MLGVFINFFLKLLQNRYHTDFIYFQINPFGNLAFEECGVVLLIYSYLFQLTVILQNYLSFISIGYFD
jgi:hypothetical protein